MDKLKYEIDGVKYFMFFTICKNKTQAEKLEEKIKDHFGIVQSIDTYNSIFTSTIVKIKVLIPENLARSFGKIDN